MPILEQNRDESNDLAEWLRARLDEDYAAAEAEGDVDGMGSALAHRHFVDQHDARADGDVAADGEPQMCGNCVPFETYPCPLLRDLGDELSTRPGYRDEWRPPSAGA
jgi:hypothetical protein